jgi:hypothetical protein
VTTENAYAEEGESLAGYFHETTCVAVARLASGGQQRADVGERTLHRLPEVVTTALPIHDILVDLARGDVRVGREGDIEEALVVTKVKIALATVVEHVHLAVLVR